MTGISKIVRPVILSMLMVLTGAVGDAQAGTCDDDCPFDSAGSFTHCDDEDLGPIRCNYSDTHYYASFGGSC